MADLPVTGPRTQASADPSTAQARYGRRRRRPPPSDTAKYARLSSVTGLVFATLFVLSLVFVHSSPGLGATDADFTAFYDSNSTALVTTGLYLVPFAGIAFLWHMNATRLLIRTRTPSPAAIPDGLQLLAGILFVALLFAGTAAAGSVALLKDLTGGPLPSVDVQRGLLALGYGMVFVYAVRGAGMYAITTTTLLMHAGVLPRWLAVLGYLLSTFLLLSTTLNPVVVLMFPGWAVLVGVVVFLRSGRLPSPTTSQKVQPA